MAGKHPDNIAQLRHWTISRVQTAALRCCRHWHRSSVKCRCFCRVGPPCCCHGSLSGTNANEAIVNEAIAMPAEPRTKLPLKSKPRGRLLVNGGAQEPTATEKRQATTPWSLMLPKRPLVAVGRCGRRPGHQDWIDPGPGIVLALPRLQIRRFQGLGLM
ncbi:hypothetical protein B0T25DRAFT_178425 [Lasiosphaeria hispida]|uniref:Uncharacterized protein n=1 Tax=Lasiosphaeria hispida TaxID=260671 RepID=A0AAJ0MH02_9PEZI|nr:hypothetical protein B0T25DRAFT_178425 [Lasiosphaeria hispida]